MGFRTLCLHFTQTISAVYPLNKATQNPPSPPVRTRTSFIEVHYSAIRFPSLSNSNRPIIPLSNCDTTPPPLQSMIAQTSARRLSGRPWAAASATWPERHRIPEVYPPETAFGAETDMTFFETVQPDTLILLCLINR